MRQCKTEENCDDHPRDEQAAVIPAQTAYLIDGDACAKQRDAEAQDASRGKVDAGLCKPFGSDRVKRHSKEQRVQQRRSAAVIGDECRGNRDDHAQQEAGPPVPELSAPTRSERRNRSGRQLIHRKSLPTIAIRSRMRIATQLVRRSSRQLSKQLFSLRPWTEPRRGIEMPDVAKVDEAT